MSLIPFNELFPGRLPEALRQPVARLLRSGGVRGYKVGRHWYVDPAEVEADIKARGSNGHNESERPASAVEGSVLYNLSRIRAAGQAAHKSVLREQEARGSV